MSARRGIDWSLIAAVAVVIALVALVTLAVVGNRAQAAECRDAGGQWVQPYKSRGICLEPGTVIEL